MLEWGFQMLKGGRHPHLVVKTQQPFTGLMEKRLNWAGGMREDRRFGGGGGGVVVVVVWRSGGVIWDVFSSLLS